MNVQEAEADSRATATQLLQESRKLQSIRTAGQSLQETASAFDYSRLRAYPGTHWETRQNLQSAQPGTVVIS